MKIISDLNIPLIVSGEYGKPPSSIILPDIELRIDDTIKILNKILARWDTYKENFKKYVDDEEARLTYIEIIFSFTIFYLLLIKYYKSLFNDLKRIFEESDNSNDFISIPTENEIVKKLIVIRNKMIGHVCFIEPKHEDTIADQLAYLTWYVNIDSDLEYAQLNRMGLKVGDISSKHIIIPPLSEVVQACNNYIHEIEKSINENYKIIKEQLHLLNSKYLKYIIVKE